MGSDIGTTGSCAGDANAVEEVNVLVTVALIVVAEEDTVVVICVVIVVVTTLVELVVLLATICSGHNWKE